MHYLENWPNKGLTKQQLLEVVNFQNIPMYFEPPIGIFQGPAYPGILLTFLSTYSRIKLGELRGFSSAPS